MTEKMEYIGFFVKETIYNKFQKLIKSEGYSHSEFMREALRNELKNRGVKFE